MTHLSDLTIPYSALKFEGDEKASATGVPAQHEVLSALLMQVVRRHAESLADGEPVAPVSVSVDVTGQVSGAAPLDFESQVDRKTRTIIFIGGTATQEGRPLLKATAVYRIG